MKPRKYDTPAAFKRALEDRLKAGSTSGVDFARRRQLLVFDRFLARMRGAADAEPLGHLADDEELLREHDANGVLERVPGGVSARA